MGCSLIMYEGLLLYNAVHLVKKNVLEFEDFLQIS